MEHSHSDQKNGSKPSGKAGPLESSVWVGLPLPESQQMQLGLSPDKWLFFQNFTCVKIVLAFFFIHKKTPNFINPRGEDHVPMAPSPLKKMRLSS